jgi:hypothetical protein
MIIDPVITQLKTAAPLFGGRVAGGADWAKASDQVWMPQPAAYVFALEDEPSANQDLTGIQQLVTETISVIVDLDNSLDRRGQGAATVALHDAKAAVFRALLGWRPGEVNAARGFAYAKGGLVEMNLARLIWQFDFALEVTLTELDGWQPPSEPLTEIRGDVGHGVAFRADF